MADFQDWLAFAEDDLRNAAILKDQKSTFGACFHAQQAAEKSLKSLILSKGEKIPKVHSLGFLLEKLGLPELNVAGKFLDRFYIESRYPDVTPGSFAEKVPSVEESALALEYATKIVDSVSLEISSAETNQRGFAPILILLIGLLIGGAIVFGYTSGVYRKLIPTKTSTNKITPTPTPEAGCYYEEVQCIKAPCPPILRCPVKESGAETANWIGYEGPGYNLKHPSDWKVSKYNGAVNFPDIILKSPDYHLTTDGIQTLDKGAEIRVDRTATTKTSIDRESLYSVPESSIKDTKVDGVEALEYEFSYESANAIATDFVNGGYYYNIRFQYSDQNSRQEYMSVYKSILSSFKFTQ